MRPFALLALLLLPACACESQPVTILLAELADTERTLPDLDLSTRNPRIIYKLVIESKHGTPLNFEAKIGEDSTAGQKVTIEKNTSVLPGERRPFMFSLDLPAVEGAFNTSIEFTCKELPGWSRVYTVRGTKTPRALPGRYLFARPTTVNLGPVRPGETRPFSFTLENGGDETVHLKRLRVRDDAPVQVTSINGNESIVAEGSLTVKGLARIPDKPGKEFRAVIEIESDAANTKVTAVTVRGEYRRKYQLVPARFPSAAAYSGRRQLYPVEVLGGPDTKPFTVAKVEGLDPYFELAEELPQEPASRVRVPFRIRADAPQSVKFVEGEIRITLSDGALQRWPFRLRILPPLFAQPSRVLFRSVRRQQLSKTYEREIQLVASTGAAPKVQRALAEKGYFTARVVQASGVPARIYVGIPAGARPGTYQDRLRIETDHPEVPVLLVEVRAVVRE
ncbi:MAG: hypothetical protein AAGD14_12550 [Planctomycetota bacterium]